VKDILLQAAAVSKKEKRIGRRGCEVKKKQSLNIQQFFHREGVLQKEERVTGTPEK